MIYEVTRHPEVDLDIMEIADTLVEHGRELAFRFLEAVEDSVSDLRFMPGRGSLKETTDPAAVGLRSCWVKGFRNHLVLYSIRTTDVYVHAVVDGRRDYRQIIQNRMRSSG